MTRQQLRLKLFIERRLAETGGVPPTYQEMADNLGVRSKSNISRMIEALEKQGIVRRKRRMQRSISMVASPAPGSAPSPAASFGKSLVERAAEEISKLLPGSWDDLDDAGRNLRRKQAIEILNGVMHDPRSFSELRLVVGFETPSDQNRNDDAIKGCKTS